MVSYDLFTPRNWLMPVRSLYKYGVARYEATSVAGMPWSTNVPGMMEVFSKSGTVELTVLTVITEDVDICTADALT